MFLATARGGTLASAAQVMRVNPSTVHRRMARMEAALGTRLFDRSQRGYALTEAGEELLTHALAIEKQVFAVGRKVVGRDQRLSGVVRVSTVDDLAVHVLPPVFAEFRVRHPGVTFDVRVGIDFADLMRQQADVALRLGMKPRDPDVVVKSVARIGVALYGSRAYLRKHGRPAALSDLAAHALVMGDERMAAVDMERLVMRYADPDRIAFRSNSMLARAAAIRDGVGIGFVPLFVARRERGLVPLALGEARLGGDLWLVVHADLKRNARVRAFVDHVLQAFRALRPELEHPR